MRKTCKKLLPDSQRAVFTSQSEKNPNNFWWFHRSIKYFRHDPEKCLKVSNACDKSTQFIVQHPNTGVYSWIYENLSSVYPVKYTMTCIDMRAKTLCTHTLAHSLTAQCVIPIVHGGFYETRKMVCHHYLVETEMSGKKPI